MSNAGHEQPTHRSDATSMPDQLSASRRLLVAVAALGGDDIDPELAAAALAARERAVQSIQTMREVPLALVNAIEPGHAIQRLRHRFESDPTPQATSSRTP